MADVQIVLPHGGYKKLVAYRKSDTVYQGTVVFCRRFLPKYGDRTVDQMIQAARSCKQNIAEGSASSGTSKETEIKLTNVARASLDELFGARSRARCGRSVGERAGGEMGQVGEVRRVRQVGLVRRVRLVGECHTSLTRPTSLTGELETDIIKESGIRRGEMIYYQPRER